MEAYLHFESGLQINLQSFNKYISVMKFINQINAKKNVWYQNYSHFKKKDTSKLIYHPNNTTMQQPNHTIKPYNNNNYRNRGPASVYRLQYTFNKKNAFTSPSTTPNIIITTSRTLQPQTYRLETQIFYNASQSTSNFNKTPAIIHISRFYSNTHDNDDDDEAQVYFINHEHDYNVINYPHHHKK